jgi:ABC-type antimicrobial peptide transport system permease subunit
MPPGRAGRATDTIAYAIPVAIVIAGGCLAALIPARRAARIDPLTKLRAE